MQLAMSENLEDSMASENIDAIEDQDLDLDLDEEENQGELKVTPATKDSEAEYKAKIAELEAKNKQLFARIKKTPEKTVKQDNNSNNGDLDWKNKIEFVTTKGRSLDAESIDEVIKYAKGAEISYAEAMDSTVIKAFLRVKQAKERVAQATPAPSSKSISINGKGWGELSEAEKADNYQKLIRAKLKK